MDLEVLKFAETWEYIQGGFLFLDESGSALALANGELKRYINSLSSVQPKAVSLIRRLRLEDREQAFEDVPASLKRILREDIAYIKQDPSDLDESFASVAMTAFYRRVSDYLNIPSDIPARMKRFVEQEAADAGIKAVW